jgi:hypothetical protein
MHAAQHDDWLSSRRPAIEHASAQIRSTSNHGTTARRRICPVELEQQPQILRSTALDELRKSRSTTDALAPSRAKAVAV